MPGSGKSTIAHAVAGSLRSAGHEVSEPTRTTDRLPSATRRRLNKVRGALNEGVDRGAEVRPGLSAILGSSQPGPVAIALSTINWFYLAGLCRAAGLHPGVTLLDQGVLQAVWSVEFGSESPRGQPVEMWAELAGDVLPRGSVVVFVDADDLTLRDRLSRRERGMSRLDAAFATSEDEFERCLARGRDALDYVGRIASLLVERGRIDSFRLDSGTGTPASLAAALVEGLPGNISG